MLINRSFTSTSYCFRTFTSSSTVTHLAMRLLLTYSFGGCKVHRCSSYWLATKPKTVAANHGVTITAASAKGKPESFDSFKLDDSYYKQVGITAEEAQEDLNALYGEDPDHYQFSDDDDDDEEYEDDQSEEEAWGNVSEGQQEGQEMLIGPPAVLLAGFRDHEFAMVRATLDRAGAHDVRVIPCRGQMLYSTLEEAWATPEPDWAAPKLDRAWSGSFGSQRTVIFSGLGEADVLMILELVEVNGMPPLMVALATEEMRGRKLGEVVAETIQEQRKRRQSTASVEPELLPKFTGAGAATSSSTIPAAFSDVRGAIPDRGIREASQGKSTAEKAESSNAAGSAGPRSEPEMKRGRLNTAEPSSLGQVQPAETSRPQSEEDPKPLERISNGTGAPGPAKQTAEAPLESPRLTEGAPGDTAAHEATGNRFVSEIESSEFASEQRAMREEAAREMERRAAVARAGGGDAMLPADNLIDAVAAGENLDTMLKAGAGKPVKDADTLKAEREELAKQKMEQVLEQLKTDAAKLPEAQRKKAAHELRMLASDKEAIGKVLSEMGQGLNSIPKNDRAEVKSKLREEAWQPTKDAIGAALACGISAEELRGFVNEAELARAENGGAWHPKVMDTVEQ